MQKKYLLFVITFSFIAQAINSGDELNIQEDPFVQLRDDLRMLRNNSDNATYANVMVKGIEAIEKAKQDKIKLIEKNRVERKDGVSSNRSNWGKERPGTLVDIEDTKIDAELNEYSEKHGKLADIYKGYTLFMHNDLSKTAHKEVDVAITKFERMERALKLCPFGDHDCYKRYKAPLYSKMTDKNYLQNKKEVHCGIVLGIAHENNIPVTGSELKCIIQKNPQYIAAIARLDELERSIDELANPDKIKEREEKSIKELEAKKAKEEEENKQALKNELQQINVPVDSNSTTE